MLGLAEPVPLQLGLVALLLACCVAALLGCGREMPVPERPARPEKGEGARSGMSGSAPRTGLEKSALAFAGFGRIIRRYIL